MVDIVQLSADSKVFYRPPFKGLLGACLSIRNPIEFSKLYREFFTDEFNKRKISCEKEVFSGSDVSRLFEKDRNGFLDFLEKFVTKIGTDSNVTLNIVWTTLSLSKLSQGVQYYGVGRTAVRPVNPNKFLDDLSQYYPYICAWTVSSRIKIVNTMVLLDDLQGEITEAWNELFANNRIWIMPNGDKCNNAISAADLCIRYFDEKLYSIKGSLNEEYMRTICDSIGVESHIYYVGHADLRYLVPIEQRKIPYHVCYKRPMIFILKEQLMPSEVEYIQRRPDVLIAIERYACKIGSGYKFIDYQKDHQYLRDGDHLIYLGPRGKEQAEYLRDLLGWKVVALSLKDVVQELKP